MTTGGRFSILLLLICLLQINILPVLDNKKSLVNKDKYILFEFKIVDSQ